jgi:acetoin utilization protein AcuB
MEAAMLTVNDLMTLDPQTISPDTPLRQIIELMKREGCRQFPVMDEQKLVGIITDRDVRLVLNSPLVEHDRRQDEELMDRISAESCMTRNPVTVTPNTPAYRAAELLGLYKFGALPVMDGETLVGIVTTTDFLNYFVDRIAIQRAREPLSDAAEPWLFVSD